MMPTKINDPLQYLVTAVAEGAEIMNAFLEPGSFSKDNTQSPVCFKGKTAVVFAFQLQKKTSALKIWPAPVGEEHRNRYLLVQKFLAKTKLPYFIGSHFIKDAVRLKGELHDVLLMDWAGRQTIKEYILANLDQKEKLHALAEKILRMHLDLNQAGIAHGHLHCGNIYVDVNTDLKLIDYDCIFIKGLMEAEECTQQYPDYCHPAHSATVIINEQADYFAALIIFVGIKAIAANNFLWGRFKIGFTENFLFSAANFTDVKNAEAYKYLRKNHSPETDRLLDILVKYCAEPNPENLKPFYTYLQTDFTAGNEQAAAENITVKKEIIQVTPASDILNHQHITIPAIAGTRGIIKPATPAASSYPDNTVQVENANEQASHSVVEQPSLPPLTRKPGPRKAHYETPLKKQKIRFLVAAAVVCATIIGASFLLGEIADNANDYQFQPTAKADSQPGALAKQTVPAAVTTAVEKPPPAVIPLAKIKDSTNTVVSPAEIPVVVKAEEKKQIVDTFKKQYKNIPVISDDLIVKNTTPKYHNNPVENKTAATREKSFTVAVSKPVNQKKQTIVKKQTEASFAIGAPPKQ